MNSDERFMLRCIQLALLGKGRAEPNPLVGAVIVHNGLVIGEGYHERYGENHAEVNAVNSVEDKSLLAESTIYVSLEPCAHFGKTPPCTDLLIKQHFKRVVIGSSDPNPEVSGKGIKRLRQAGIEVETGILKKNCDFINRKFLTFHEKHRPFVLLKWAESANGLLDDQGKRASISAPELQSLVHQWRSEYDAIMVGRKTVENDDPELNVRKVNGKNPVRVVLDPKDQLGTGYKVFDGSIPTIVLTEKRSEEKENLRYISLNQFEPFAILGMLYELNIQSVMIEGGAFTLNEFVKANLWDEARVIRGIVHFEGGTPAPKIEKAPAQREVLFNNSIETYLN